MHTPVPPTLLAEKLVFRDLNSGLSPESRLAAFERISRFAEHHHPLGRLLIELEQDPATAADHRFTAKGQLEFDGPALFSSVASDDPIRSLDFLLEKFDRQLRRRPRLRHPSPAPQPVA